MEVRYEGWKETIPYGVGKSRGTAQMFGQCPLPTPGCCIQRHGAAAGLRQLFLAVDTDAMRHEMDVSPLPDYSSLTPHKTRLRPLKKIKYIPAVCACVSGFIGKAQT